MKEIKSIGKATAKSYSIHLNESEIVICPWCYNVTDFKSEKTFTCKICKRQITPEDLINYQITKEGE